MFASLKRYRGRAAILAFAAFLPLLMAPSGGLPSRPRFQSVMILGAGTGYAPAQASLGLSSSAPIISINESAAAANNRLWSLSAQGEALLGRALTDDESSAGTWLEVNRTAHTVDTVNLRATSVQANGVAIPTSAYGYMDGSAGGCTIDAAYASQGVSGCVRNGVGQYTLTVTGFATRPVCQATASSNPGETTAVASAANTVVVLRYNSAGAAIDSDANVHCVGT